MRNRRHLNIYTFFLLLYFVGFPVSSVSAILTSDFIDIDSHPDFISSKSPYIDVFLSDMALWEMLESTIASKNAKDVLISSDRGSHRDDFDRQESPCAIVDVQPCSALKGFSEHNVISLISLSAFYSLTNSGLSPPFLS